MKLDQRIVREVAAVSGLLLLVLLALPPARALLESSMSRHMLLQFPLIACGGWLLAGALPARWRAAADRFNAYGITGLVLTASVLSLGMIPRLLDLVLVDVRMAVAKWLAIAACGAALRLSWARAGWVVQAFFLGNILPMTAVAGQLYQDAPLRLCNAYLLDDQLWLGQALVGVALAGAVAWTAALFVALVRRDSGSLPKEAPSDADASPSTLRTDPTVS